MADILIKNFEMPKSCITGKLPDYEYCPFFGVCSKVSAKTERPSDCPLVELLPHGDLIDRSHLKAVAYEIMRFPADEANEMYLELIDNAPTIVEAST